MTDFVKCEAEDQGGHQGCEVPATLVTKKPDKFGLHYYCHEHKTNKHVWREDELEPMTPTREMVNGLTALYDDMYTRLENAGTRSYIRDKGMAEALGVPADFWNEKKLIERAKELVKLANASLTVAKDDDA